MPCKTYKIGVFFDGTGNNADFDSSNGRNQQSNVAKLHKLYKTGEFKSKEGYKVTASKIYIKGIGTYDTQDEYDKHPIKRKYDKGGGGGGAQRINDAINDVTKFLDAHPYEKDNPDKFSKREIDVFGFSRGSATARDFVNTFTTKKINKKKQYKDVRFNFIGIYDTVASFGEPGNDDNYKPRAEFVGKRGADEAYLPSGPQLRDENYGIRDPKEGETLSFPLAFVVGKAEAEQKAEAYRAEGWENIEVVDRDKDLYEIIGKKDALEVFVPYNFNLCAQSAKKIVHMTAHDEVRKNFPLTNIQGSGGKSCVMMGVHSDVGGGYAPSKMERHEFPYRGHWRGVSQAAHTKATELSGLGGSWSVEKATCARNGVGHFILLRKVLNDLSNVTLHLMYEQAKKAKVTFNPLPQDENHAILPNIANYYAYAKENLSKAYTYDSTADGKLLQETQRHHSSADPAQINTNYVGNTKLWDDAWKNDSADGGGNDAQYVDKHGEPVDGRLTPNLAVEVKRSIFPNNAEEAISPV